MKRSVAKVLLIAALAALALGFPWQLSHQLRSAETPPAPDRVVDAQTAFALDLYRQLRAGEGNLIFSPVCISSNLTMAWAGAGGNTAQELSAALHLPAGEPELHAKTAKLLAQLSGRKDVDLQLANALWLQRGYAFFGPAVAQVKKDYSLETFPVDFNRATEAARKDMNAWGAKHTNNRISESVPKGFLNELTRLVFSSAIYFKGEWLTRFDKEATKDEPFHVSPDKDVTVPMMSAGGGKFRWCGTEEYDALEMSYKESDVSMLVVLPRAQAGLTALEEKMTPANLKLLLDSLFDASMQVQVPRFSLEQDMPLKDALKKLGVVGAFENRAGNFPGFTAEPLNLDVLHSAFIVVDEQGTEAGAIQHTGGFGCSAAAMPRVFRADHPFLFLIRDARSGSILFMGRVVNPRS